MELLNLVKKEFFRLYLKINYYNFCKELNINKQYTAKIKNKYSFYLFNIQYMFTKNCNDFKSSIVNLYISILFDDLRINHACFSDYMDKRTYNINILDSLLHDKDYIYNVFLFENLLLLKESLETLYLQLDSINNLSNSDTVKNKELKLKKEIYKHFDSFFNIVNKLNLRRCS